MVPESQEILEALRDMPGPNLKCPAGPRGPMSTREIAVLHVSDVQFGKVTSSYDSKVARRRLEELGRRASAVLKSRRISELRLYLGGDIVEGQGIFPGQSLTIDSSVQAQAIHGAAACIARLVLGLLEVVERVKVVSVRGNHGRSEEASVNWDEVCYEVAKRDLLGGQDLFPEKRKLSKRVQFGLIGRWYQVDRVFSWGNLLVHGDQFKGSFAGSGFKSKVVGWIDAIPEAWDYVWFGHFHTFGMGTINRRTYLANGTTESDNSYAQEQFAAVGTPVQRLAIFNEKYGLISDHPIYLGNRRPNR